MEIIETSLLYIGIEEGGILSCRPGRKKEGLPIRELERRLPFLIGSGSAVRGKLRVCYVLLPEYKRKSLIGKKKKVWSRNEVKKSVEHTISRAADCREHVLAAALTGEGSNEDMPLELMAAQLYACRPFDTICISLGEEGGEYQVERVIELITPYLPRLRRVLWAGYAGRQRERLEDYLYQEFGLVMTDMEKLPGRNVPWLDLDPECGERVLECGANCCGRHINRVETLKFLDTMVKNRYNTEVN